MRFILTEIAKLLLGFSFPIFLMVNGNSDTSIPQRLLKFFLQYIVRLSSVCETSKICSKSPPSKKHLQKLMEMQQGCNVSIVLI